MIGLIINHLGREYKIGSKDKFDTYLLISLISHREEFILEGGIGKIASFQKIRNELKVEVEIDDFKECELSPSITEKNNTSEIGVEYYRMTDARDLEWEWEQKLKRFYNLEKILKEEGLL